MKKVEDKHERMEQLGVISRVDQPTDWCAGMVVVPKQSGSVRICVDLTKLNESVLRETHPLPRIDNLLAQVNDSKIFTKIDANSGFRQEKLAEESRLLTTFLTPFGRFCFNRMPVGVKSAPEHYQKKISQLLAGKEGVISIIDDILAHGRTQDEHDKRLADVLTTLKHAGVTLNDEKCEFSKGKLKFAGHVLSADGVKSNPEKTESIRELDTPQNVGDVRRFLGMVNQFGKFIPRLAEKTKALRDLLSKKNESLWGSEQQQAFTQLKAELSSTAALAHYDTTKLTIVPADGSTPDTRQRREQTQLPLRQCRWHRLSNGKPRSRKRPWQLRGHVTNSTTTSLERTSKSRRTTNRWYPCLVQRTWTRCPQGFNVSGCGWCDILIPSRTCLARASSMPTRFQERHFAELKRKAINNWRMTWACT